MMLKKVQANMPVLRTFTTMIEAPVNPIDGSNRRQGILMHRNIFRRVTTAALTLTATFAFGLGTSSEAWGGQDSVGSTDRTSAWDKIVTTDRTSAWDKVVTLDRTSAWD